MLSANFIGKKSKGEKYFLLLVTSLLFIVQLLLQYLLWVQMLTLQS